MKKNFLFFHVRNTRRKRRGYLQNPVINPKGEKLAHQKSPSILQSALIWIFTRGTSSNNKHNQIESCRSVYNSVNRNREEKALRAQLSPGSSTFSTFPVFCCSANKKRKKMKQQPLSSPPTANSVSSFSLSRRNFLFYRFSPAAGRHNFLFLFLFSRVTHAVRSSLSSWVSC